MLTPIGERIFSTHTHTHTHTEVDRQLVSAKPNPAISQVILSQINQMKKAGVEQSDCRWYHLDLLHRHGLVGCRVHIMLNELIRIFY